MALRGSSFQSRVEGGEGKGREGGCCVYRVYRVAPQGHITALIQFHVNLRVNATLIRWRVVAAAVVDAAKATPDPGLTCGTARFKCVRGTGKVRCAGAFKIIYNICENMFAKCQTTLSSAALCNFFLARPEKVCYSFFAFFPSLSLSVFLFFCNNLRPVTHRPCACAWGCACVWADWNVLRLHLRLHLNLCLCLLPPSCDTGTRMCWQHLCNGKFVRIVRAAGELLPPSLPACLPPRLRLWPHEIGVLLSTSWRAIQNSSKFAKTICKSTANTCKYWYDTVCLRNW